MRTILVSLTMQTVTGYYFILSDLPLITCIRTEVIEKPRAGVRRVNQQPSSYG
jgi:hypothetical protein